MEKLPENREIKDYKEGDTESHSIDNSQSKENFNFNIGNTSPEKPDIKHEKEEGEKQLEEREKFADQKVKEFTEIVEKYFGHIPGLGEASEQSEPYKKRQGDAFLHFSFHSVEWEKKNNPESKKILHIWDNLVKATDTWPLEGQREHPETLHFRGSDKNTTKKIFESIGLQKTFEEYKIHLQPKKEYLPLIVDKLTKAIKNNPELREVITRFKVSLHEHSKEQRWQPAMGKPVTEYVPEIVIYPLIGKKNSESALQKIMEIFKNEEVEKYGNNLTPRANLKVNNLIYFAQGDGYLKKILSQAQNKNELDRLKLKYLTEGNETAIQTLPKATTLLEDYFNEKYNFGLIKGEEPPQFVKDYWKANLKEGKESEEGKKEEIPPEKQPEELPEKAEEPQQTPEQQLKDEVEKFFVEQVQADRHFFSKDITPKEFRTWQEITQIDFKTFSEEKQKILMEMLANELGKNSNLIENAQKDLESKTIDKKEKDEIKKGLKEYLQPLQKAIRARTQVYHLALHPKKPPEKQLSQQPGKTEKKEEKLNQEKAEKIKAHFYEELKKVQDLSQETEIKKWRKTNECLRLIDDWLPFGYLDNFEGVDKVMEILEDSKSKLKISSPLIQEKTAQRIAHEMALQYKFWEKDNQTKIDKIDSFIDKWLKEKSVFYQRGEKFKNNALKQPNKISQWFVDQISVGLKLIGQRDRTLNRVSRILALQNVPYSKDIDQLISNIENKNIRFESIAEVHKIEEWEDKTKLKYLMNFKVGLGPLPIMPLKVDYYEKLIEEKAKNLKPEDKTLLMTMLEELKAGTKNKEMKEKLEQLGKSISGVVEKEKQIPKPEAVKDATEFVKKEEKKGKESIFQKMGGWGTVGGVAGFSLMMFLILIFLGEFKLLEKATGIDLEGGGKGKK